MPRGSPRHIVADRGHARRPRRPPDGLPAFVEAAGADEAPPNSCRHGGAGSAITAAADAEAAEEDAEDSGDPAAIMQRKDATEEAESPGHSGQAAADLPARTTPPSTPRRSSRPRMRRGGGGRLRSGTGRRFARRSYGRRPRGTLRGLPGCLRTRTPSALTRWSLPPVTVPAAPGSTTPVVTNPVSRNSRRGRHRRRSRHEQGPERADRAKAEPGVHPGLALLAGLLAAGIAVPAAVAMRMRRLERSRS